MKILYLIPVIFISMAAGYIVKSTTDSVREPYTLANSMTVFSKDKIEPTKAGWAHWFTRKELSGGVNLKMSYIESGNTNHAPHQHADDEILFILEGEAEFTLGNEKTVAGPNTSLYCAPNILHGINRVGDKPLKYLVIKLN